MVDHDSEASRAIFLRKSMSYWSHAAVWKRWLERTIKAWYRQRCGAHEGKIADSTSANVDQACNHDCTEAIGATRRLLERGNTPATVISPKSSYLFSIFSREMGGALLREGSGGNGYASVASVDGGSDAGEVGAFVGATGSEYGEMTLR